MIRSSLGNLHAGDVARATPIYLLLSCLAVAASYLAVCAALLVSYRWVLPPVTAVQLQRAVESAREGEPYRRDYKPRPASSISSSLVHAVVAAEDSRFFEHRGIDWSAVETAVREGRGRGASTISQQLTKNLFLTTHRSYLRKVVEVPLTLLAEIVLPKDRILELYVNVVEWGPGVYGAEAAMRYHFTASAARTGRRHAAALAACLPDPRRRRPQLNGRYTNVILRRMNQMGY
jgi:monofunctional biosynthetic peptidoglycan transglycosylase